jgi:hypothetical protein
MEMTYRDYLWVSLFVILLGTAMTATVSDGPMSHMKGAWVTHAMR